MNAVTWAIHGVLFVAGVASSYWLGGALGAGSFGVGFATAAYVLARYT